MQYTAADHKDMPDGVHVMDLLLHIENHAQGIQYAAYNQCNQTERGYALIEGLDGKNDAPAHENIAESRNFAEFFQIDRGHHDTEHCRTPDAAEDRPAKPEGLDTAEGEGRVGSCDQQKNRVVVEDLKYLFGKRRYKCVVECGHGVENDEGCTENRSGNDLHSAAVDGAEDDENDASCNGEQRTDAVCHGIEDFLTQCVGTLGFLRFGLFAHWNDLLCGISGWILLPAASGTAVLSWAYRTDIPVHNRSQTP